MEKIKIKPEENLEIAMNIYEAKEPKAVIQIIHGMCEHKERYEDFIKFLNENQYTVIISDNRGHGESISEAYPLGHLDSIEKLVEDQHEVTKQIKSRFPTKDIYLFGHSMGSLIARAYLQAHDEEIKKLVLCGTVCYQKGVNLGISVVKLVKNIQGPKHKSKIAYFFGNRGSWKEDNTWLSYNKENIEKYEEDPLCGFKFTNEGYLTLLKLDKNLHQYKKDKVKNTSLPILSVTGEDDPVTGGKKGLEDSINTLKKVGYENVKSIVYPNKKHEILNEDQKEVVYKDILEFFSTT